MTEFLDVEGGRIAYDVTGSGPLVVLSHGIGQLPHRVRHQVDADPERPQGDGRVDDQHVDPGRVQRERRGEPADARSGDDHFHPSMIPDIGGQTPPRRGVEAAFPVSGPVRSVNLRCTRACPPHGGRARSR